MLNKIIVIRSFISPAPQNESRRAEHDIMRRDAAMPAESRENLVLKKGDSNVFQVKSTLQKTNSGFLAPEWRYPFLQNSGTHAQEYSGLEVNFSHFGGYVYYIILALTPSPIFNLKLEQNSSKNIRYICTLFSFP